MTIIWSIDSTIFIECDSLLKIITSDYHYKNNQALLYSESGDVVGLKELYQTGFDFTSCSGLNGFTPLHHACNRFDNINCNNFCKIIFYIWYLEVMH